MIENIIEVLNGCLSQAEVTQGFDADDNPIAEDSEVSTHLKAESCKVNNIRRLISKTIEYIGNVVIFNGAEVQLAWHHIEPYLSANTPDGNHLYSHITAIFSKNSVPHFVSGDPVCKVVFKQQQDLYAIAFLAFLNHILPLKNTKYPQLFDEEVLLTTEQYYFFAQYAMDSTGKLSNWCIADRLLKTLRADEFDFSYQFILGIIPGENGSRRLHNLRPSYRKPYTITPQGEVISRLSKQPLYQPEMKKGFSQVQSCTLIDDEGLSPAFGFAKIRNTKLYGLITSTEDALITRLLLEDSGTVTRPFDHEDETSAMSSLPYEAYVEKTFYPKHELAEFKARNKQVRPSSTKTNEVLARLRYNPYHSVVSICSDTLEARLLAYDFAQELLEHYTAQGEKKGATVNPHFKIPIVFYVPKTEHNNAHHTSHLRHEIRLYTDEMRKQDQEKAVEIYHSIYLRSQYFKRKDYEFLLGLPEGFIRDLFLEECTQLSLDMIRNGYARMLSRILTATTEKPNLRDEVVRLLVEKGFVKQNDPVIAILIWAEEFDLADRFIVATCSDKYKLNQDKCGLVDHLIKHGNPRHLNYMDLNILLPKAAQQNSWVVVRLCLKEYPDLSPALLGRLLAIACRAGELATAKYLLKRGADTARKDGIAPINFAESCELMMLFTDYPTDAEDKSEYGYALLQALRQGDNRLAKLLLQAGAKPNWRRHSDKGHELQSTLWYAIARDDNTLLPQLIEHEKHYRDQYSFARDGLALTLAHEKGNQEAIALLEANFPSTTLIDPANMPASICRRVLEFLAVGESEMAERILLRYCYQFQLLARPIDQKTPSTRIMMSLFNYKPLAKSRDDLTTALQIIMPYFIEALNSLPFAFGAILPPIVKWLLRCKVSSLFRYITDLSAFDACAGLRYSEDNPMINEFLGCIGPELKLFFVERQMRESVLKAFFDNLTQDNISLVQEIVDHCFTIHQTLIRDATAAENIVNRVQWGIEWESALDKEFSCALGTASPSRSLLLYELGPTISADLVVPLLEKAFSSKRMNIVHDLVNNPAYDQSVKEKMALTALDWCESDSEILAMMENNIEVTAEHVRKATICFRKNLLLAFLDSIDKTKYASSEYQWNFYRAFHSYAFSDLVIVKKLIDLLGATMIRHFALICLLISLGRTTTFGSHKERWPTVARFFDENELRIYSTFLLDGKGKEREHDEKLLSILNDYFVGVGTGPKEDITRDTYKKILGIVESALGVEAFQFKISSPPRFQLDNRVYRMMKQLDQLLSQSEPTLTEVGISYGR